MIHRAAFRTAFPMVSSWVEIRCSSSTRNRCGACMHGVWHVLVSFRTIPDSLRSSQGFEMRVRRPHRRFSTVENRVTSTPHQHISVRPDPQVSIQPASSRHRSPTRSPTVRGSRHSPIAVSRQSKIGRVDRPRQRVCKQLSDRILQGRQTACAVAPSLPHTLADCARQPAQPHRRFSTVENRPRRPPAPTCVQAT